MTKNTVISSDFIEYPIKVNGYVADWNQWDIIRELVSNAKDTYTKVSIKIEGSDLIITDSGSGLTPEALLMGESVKLDNNSIGKFGEGLKLACLVALRLGMKVEIFSKKFYFFNSLAHKMNRDILRIDYQEYADSLFEGSKVIVHNWNTSEDYTDKFILSDSDSRIIAKNSSGYLMKASNRLFVRDIFVIDSLGYAFDYNLKSNVNINRDRNALNMIELNQEVGSIWAKIEDPSLWASFWKAVKEGKTESQVSFGYFYNIPENTKDAIKESVKKAFGSNPILCNNESEISEMSHRGYDPIITGTLGSGLQNTLGRIFGDAQTKLRELASHDIVWISSHKLDDKQKFTMSLLRKVCKRSGFDHKYLRAADLTNQSDNESCTVAGICDTRTGYVYLDINTLYDLEASIGVLIHELAHLNGSSDLTDYHVHTIQRISGKVILSYGLHDSKIEDFESMESGIQTKKYTGRK